MKIFLIPTILIAVLFSPVVIASSSGTLWISLGAFSENFMSAQTNITGSRNLLDKTPLMCLGTTFPIFANVLFSPGIGYGKSLEVQDNSSKSYFIFKGHFVSSLNSVFNVRYGLSTTISKISGKGGTVSLSDGNSTSTFYVPETARSSYTTSLDIGLDYMIASDWSARAEVFVTRFLSGSKRKVNQLLSVVWYL